MDWITFDKTSGSGSGIVVATATPNTGFAKRSGEITVHTHKSSSKIKVVQLAKPYAESSSYVIPAAGGTVKRFIHSDYPWGIARTGRFVKVYYEGELLGNEWHKAPDNGIVELEVQGLANGAPATRGLGFDFAFQKKDNSVDYITVSTQQEGFNSNRVSMQYNLDGFELYPIEASYLKGSDVVLDVSYDASRIANINITMADQDGNILDYIYDVDEQTLSFTVPSDGVTKITITGTSERYQSLMNVPIYFILVDGYYVGMELKQPVDTEVEGWLSTNQGDYNFYIPAGQKRIVFEDNLSIQDFDTGHFEMTEFYLNGFTGGAVFGDYWVYLDYDLSESFRDDMDFVHNFSYQNITYGQHKDDRGYLSYTKLMPNGADYDYVDFIPASTDEVYWTEIGSTPSEWNYRINADWILFDFKSNERLYLRFADNTSPEERVGTVTIYNSMISKDFEILQKGAQYLNVSNIKSVDGGEYLNNTIPSFEGQYKFDVDTSVLNYKCIYSPTVYISQVSLTPNAFYFTVANNPSETSRPITFRFKATGAEDVTIRVTQQGTHTPVIKDIEEPEMGFTVEEAEAFEEELKHLDFDISGKPIKKEIALP